MARFPVRSAIVSIGLAASALGADALPAARTEPGTGDWPPCCGSYTCAGKLYEESCSGALCYGYNCYYDPYCCDVCQCRQDCDSGETCARAGSCCVRGACIDSVTRDACIALGGEFQGQMMTCGATTCGGAMGWVAGKGLAYPNGNDVRGLRADGTPEASFSAYSAGHWGVNVATGLLDVQGDDAIITGPGPGTVFGPHIRAFSGLGVPVPGISFFAYATLRYGSNVAAGGLNGDVRDEILTAPGPGQLFGPHIRGFAYDGTSTAALPWLSYYAYATLRYGANVAPLLQQDWPTTREILTGPGPGPVFGPDVRGWDCPGTVLPIPTLRFDAFPEPGYGVNVAGSPVTDILDLACAHGPGSAFTSLVAGFEWDGLPVQALPSGQVTPFPSLHGARVAFGAINEDVRWVLLASPGPGPGAASQLAAYRYYERPTPGFSTVQPPFDAFPGTFYGATVASRYMGY